MPTLTCSAHHQPCLGRIPTAPGCASPATLGAIDLAGLYISNLLAIIFTAGLAVPWAVVRTLRYRMQNFTMLVSEEVVHEASPELLNISATGQELGEIFNVNFGV